MNEEELDDHMKSLIDWCNDRHLFPDNAFVVLLETALLIVRGVGKIEAQRAKAEQ